VITLFVIVAALLSLNLYALSCSPRTSRIPFAVAVVALVVAILGPFAGVLRLPLPSNFLLLWLLFIPIAAICAVAATLLGILALASQTFTPRSPQPNPGTASIVLAPAAPKPVSSGPVSGRTRFSQHRRWILTMLPAVVILVAAGLNLATPLRLVHESVQGIETSTGTVVGDTRYGATFTSAVSGDVTGAFTASVNYRPAYPRPALTHLATGGSWSLAVYRQGQYQGTVFGPVGTGTLHWNVDVTEGAISVDLQVTGGTGTYLGVHGHAHFSGSLLHTTYPPTVGGNLDLDLNR